MGLCRSKREFELAWCCSLHLSKWVELDLSVSWREVNGNLGGPVHAVTTHKVLLRDAMTTHADQPTEATHEQLQLGATPAESTRRLLGLQLGAVTSHRDLRSCTRWKPYKCDSSAIE